MDAKDRQIAALAADLKTLLSAILDATNLEDVQFNVRRGDWITAQEDMPRHPDA